MRQGTKMRGVWLALAVPGLVLGGVACDKLAGGGAKPAEGGAAKTAPTAAKGGAAADGSPEEKARFLTAYVEAACAVKTTKDLSKVVDLTRTAYTKQGFNQLSYASATKRYAADPEVKKALDAGLAKCAPAPAEAAAAAPAAGEAKPGEPAPAGAGEAKAEDKPAPTEGEAKAEDKPADKPAPTASPHKGQWAGTLTGGEVSGTLEFSVDAGGKALGRVKGKTPTGFKMAFGGAFAGNRLSLNARKGGPDHATFKGTVDGGSKVASGTWSGVLAGKLRKGTWRATHSK